MKIALFQIICAFIAIIDLAKTRSTESTSEIKKYKPHTSTGGISGTIPDELNDENHSAPEIHTEDDSGEIHSSYLRTTRRPLMKSRKFTSKPHVVHYVHSLTHAQQSNFSKRRNANAKKQFKTQNKKGHHSSEDLDSGERFRNFTDISNIDEGQNKRKTNSNRQMHRRRGYPLAIAASEHFKTVALPFLKSKNVLSKSKLAINESLQKIRSMRPGMKEAVTTETSKIKSNILTTPRIIEINETNSDTSEKSVPLASTSEEPANDATTNTLVISEPSTEIINYSVTTTEKYIYSTSETQNMHSLTTGKPFQTLSVENLDKAVLKVDNTELFVKAIEKWDSHRTTTENLVNFGTTTENLFNSTVNTEASILSATPSEKPNESITTTDKAIHFADTIKGTNQSNTEIDKTLMIVMGQSLPEVGMNTVEPNISDNVTTIEQNNDTNSFTNTKENIVTITPIPNGDEVTPTEEIAHNSALRSKRRINVIEEERVATTSTGFRYSERGTPISIDFTFKNIHT